MIRHFSIVLGVVFALVAGLRAQQGGRNPLSLAFLPNGDMLVRAGRFRIIKNGMLDPQPVSGVPQVRGVAVKYLKISLTSKRNMNASRITNNPIDPTGRGVIFSRQQNEKIRVEHACTRRHDCAIVPSIRLCAASITMIERLAIPYARPNPTTLYSL